MHAVLRRNQAGQKRRPRRRADGVARQGPREADALGSQAVDVGRADVRIAVAAEGPGTLIVGEDEDEVGWPVGGGGLTRRRGGAEEAGEGPRKTRKDTKNIHTFL